MPSPRLRLALLLDPRFSGGTASAVAREIRALAPHTDLSVYGLETQMFKDRTLNPHIQSALLDTGLDLVWNPPMVRAEVVAVHNNAALKFNTTLSTRIMCDRLFVVTHENFLRPGGAPGFDVDTTIALLEQASLCRARFLAPVSPYNRQGVQVWLAQSRRRWALAPFDWVNICDFTPQPPTDTPRDRRGRLSRPGFEKFPPLADLHRQFPPHAEVHILGGDALLRDPATLPGHWNVLPFGAMDVDAFLQQIDFFLYYTHPQWRESFGRVIAEAIAAGKIVITDPGTAQTFGPAVVADEGPGIEATIARFIADPSAYAAFVRQAQAHMAQFSAEAFAAHLLPHLHQSRTADHALL